MADDFPHDDEGRGHGPWAVSTFLTPPVCGVAAFTLAVLALLDQNAVTIGFAALAEQQVSGPAGFYVLRGVATAAQVGVVLVLAGRSFAAAGREALLGRAAVLVAGVALVAAVLAVVGGVLR